MSEPSPLLVEDVGAARWLTLNRPDDGNKFTPELLADLKRALEEARADRSVQVIVLTGAGDKFFCIGGAKGPRQDELDYATVAHVVDLYQLIDQMPKPVVASVNGFAVGGGHVLHVVCDLTIAKESAIFRQVGPLMGSFDPGFGTWYLEDLVGKKRAKEMWFLNEKVTAQRALEIGLVNFVVPDGELREATVDLCERLAARGGQALAAVKLSFTARSGGVGGFSRLAHDLLLRDYLQTDEATELQTSFNERRMADSSKFWR